MSMIFDGFDSMDDAKKFANYISEKFHLWTGVYESQEESDAEDPFPFELTPPIVLVERPEFDFEDGMFYCCETISEALGLSEQAVAQSCYLEGSKTREEVLNLLMTCGDCGGYGATVEEISGGEKKETDCEECGGIGKVDEHTFEMDKEIKIAILVESAVQKFVDKFTGEFAGT